MQIHRSFPLHLLTPGAGRLLFVPGQGWRRLIRSDLPLDVAAILVGLRGAVGGVCSPTSHGASGKLQVLDWTYCDSRANGEHRSNNGDEGRAVASCDAGAVTYQSGCANARLSSNSRLMKVCCIPDCAVCMHFPSPPPSPRCIVTQRPKSACNRGARQNNKRAELEGHDTIRYATTLRLGCTGQDRIGGLIVPYVQNRLQCP